VYEAGETNCLREMATYRVGVRVAQKPITETENTNLVIMKE
jgi:hypothetical protein